MDSKKTEVAEIFFFSVMNPWVRWPPSGRSSPMILPWGSTRAVYTAKFAGVPAARAHQDRQVGVPGHVEVSAIGLALLSTPLPE